MGDGEYSFRSDPQVASSDDRVTFGGDEGWALAEMRNVAVEDGAVVPESVPDSDLLHARYDATELSATDGDPVSTWTDATGNGHGLTAGSAPTYRTGVINGNAVVRFDGSGDILDTTWAEVTQPIWVFVAGEFHQTPSTSQNEYVISYGDPSVERLDVLNNGNASNRWATFAPNGIESAADADASTHVWGVEAAGTGSEFRLDGVSEGTADQTSTLSGLTAGAYLEDRLYAPVDVGEVLVYDGAPTVSEVEQYLAGKWGVTLS